MSIEFQVKATIPIIVVSSHITSNFIPMLVEASLYDIIFNSTGKTVSEILPSLIKGHKDMSSNPNKYIKLESKNGWGTYYDCIGLLSNLISDIKDYPEGVIE